MWSARITQSALVGRARELDEIKSRLQALDQRKGSLILLSGEPGMGKSTLLMQALGLIAARGARCLLVCAEESTAQVRMRADRLGALAPEFFVVSET